MEKLSLTEARRLALAAQGLHGQAAKNARAALERLGYAQIDSISVIERAHHHTLWSRVPSYRPGGLERLVARKQAFEYWWHAAAYLPLADYRWYLPRMRALRAGEAHWFQSRLDRRVMTAVLARIRAEGPLKASDFQVDKRSEPWWGWKPAKIALERLFQEGRLLTARRDGFQKVYDLPERVLPAGLDLRLPAPREWGAWLARRHLRAHGPTRERELVYLRGPRERRALARGLRDLAEAGAVLSARIEGLPGIFWLLRESLETPLARDGGRLRLLSPFDNAVIQRKRLAEMFAFDFQLECYVPAPKRRWGYFVCPLLHRGRFVGRLDAKAERAAGVLSVRGLWFESAPDDELLAAAAAALNEFAAFNGCVRWELRLPGRPRWRVALLRAAGG